ncbi:MAG: hypothetical protein PSV13_10650 [Lacunisphaera sp.]|nr:hypothetical protein [Lacunisphaera sp.]
MFLALGSLLLALCPTTATELTDLGQGLSYLRVHSPADSFKAAAGTGALVLDLRYAMADETSAAELKSTLAARPANMPLFVLVSPDTPAVLAPIIHQSPALTLGIAGARPAPKVVVRAEAAADRSAYIALETGTALAPLVSGKVEKERYDEASLVEEFKNGNLDAQPPAAPDPTAATAGQPEEPKAGGDPAKPAVPTDRVLQRAVHLHRALLALRR